MLINLIEFLFTFVGIVSSLQFTVLCAMYYVNQEKKNKNPPYNVLLVITYY